MKPLRTSSRNDATHKESSKTDPPPALHASVTSHNGEVTCSVEETNRIRAALGLRPLRTGPSAVAKVEPVEEKPVLKQASDIQKRLEKARRARQTRSRAVAVRSIAEEALLDEDSEDGSVDHERGLAQWVARSRKKDSEPEPLVIAKRMRKKEHSLVPGKNKLQQGQKPTNPMLPESATPGEILTLADVPVVRNNEDGEVQDYPEDALENPLKATKKRPRSPEICGATYDGTDAKEFSGDVQMTPETVSIEPKGPSTVESDYREPKAVDIEKTFRKRRKRDGSKPEKKKRRRVRAVEEDVPHEPHKLRPKVNIIKGRMEDLRRAANARMVAGDGSSDDDALYASLAKARRKAKASEMKSSVDTILEAIDLANASTGVGDSSALAEDAAQSVYNEMEQFLQKIPTALDSSDEEEDRMQTDVNDVELSNSPSETVAVKADVIREKIAEGSKTTSPEAEPPKDQIGNGLATEETGHVMEPTAEALDLPEASSGDPGIASTLRRLRAMGELKHKNTQLGRARDKRFDVDDQGDPEDIRKRGFRDIKLSYTDEFGNELTKKEAFRMLCHKFHGKGPGQNKREKRLREMLEATKARNMRADDTPLASVAALKEETRKLGSAHVVLSGPQALAQTATSSSDLPRTEEKRPPQNDGKFRSETTEEAVLPKTTEDKRGMARRLASIR